MDDKRGLTKREAKADLREIEQAIAYIRYSTTNLATLASKYHQRTLLKGDETDATVLAILTEAVARIKGLEGDVQRSATILQEGLVNMKSGLGFWRS